ncbi:hypothetical protein CY652_14450 [Burkholderia sp. WAC0059]|uniref:AlpA family phage regulatory protein n=1 Tax=Burkholderia sp. WAC0059 TaxID=2066022 RepID=UPI000C7ED249|nr:AlpA family phage regulatory protein [Burkholderia sp. WAC0059]PLZ01860.1 hypothetical protein CY652_14450 [Burkholderia sp. WAC0059]
MSDRYVAGAILRRKQVEQVVGLSGSTISISALSSTFPKSVSLGVVDVGVQVSRRSVPIEMKF